MTTPRRLLPALLERLPFPVLRTGAQAGAVLGARLGGAAANFFVVLILTRAMAPADVGLVLTAMAAAVLGEVAATMGRDAVAVQAVPQALARGEQARASAYARSLASQVVWGAPLAGLGAGAALFFVSNGSASLVTAMLCAGLVIGMTALRALSRLVMAAGGVALGAVPMLGLRPGVLLCLVLVSWRSGGLDAETALGCAVAASVLTFALQFVLGARLLRFVRTPPSGADPSWGPAGRQLVLPGLMIGELPNLVTLLAAVFLAAPQVALLGVCLRVAGLIALGSRSLVAAVSPRLSAAWATDGIEGAQRMGRAVPMLAAPATLIVVSGVWLLAPQILAAFGSEYAAGAWPLRVLSVMPLLSACAGPSLLALTAAERTKEAGRAAWPAVAVLCALTLLGAVFGVLGVAIGVLSAVAFWEVSLILRLDRSVGLSLWLPFGPRAG